MSLHSNERAIEVASVRSALKKFANCPSVPMEFVHEQRVLKKEHTTCFALLDFFWPPRCARL
jgi:hypothetical protein